MSETTGPTSATIETSDHAIIARSHKKMMDDAELKTLRSLIDEASAANAAFSVVVIDLSDVKLLPSLALGLLVEISNKCKTRQQKLKLAGVQAQVRQVFSITKLDRVFEFAPSVEAAIV